MSADLLDSAVPEFSDVVGGREKFNTAAKSAGRKTLKKQLGSDSRTRSAGRVIPTKSAEQNGWLRRDIFTNVPHYSSRIIFGTNLLWQFLEITERKSQ